MRVDIYGQRLAVESHPEAGVFVGAGAEFTAGAVLGAGVGTLEMLTSLRLCRHFFVQQRCDDAQRFNVLLQRHEFLFFLAQYFINILHY
jgi:hypothetical protein